MSAQPAADDQAELAVVDVVQKEVCVERMRWMKRIMNEEEFEFELHEDIMIEIRWGMIDLTGWRMERGMARKRGWVGQKIEAFEV